jgi:mRNA interferase RelE/StbE
LSTRSKYLFQTNALVISEDLPALPPELRATFLNEYRPILSADPYGCSGFPNHDLTGRLKDYRTLEIVWDGVVYLLVYRVYESPAPKRVYVVSFDEHDPAYEKAKERTGRKR